MVAQNKKKPEVLRNSHEAVMLPKMFKSKHPTNSDISSVNLSAMQMQKSFQHDKQKSNQRSIPVFDGGKKKHYKTPVQDRTFVSDHQLSFMGTN